MELNSAGIIFFLSLLGVFNGVLLSLYLFFFTKKKSLSKYLLAALVLALSLRIGKSVLLYFNRDLSKIYLQIGLSACLFIGPLLYYYLKSVVQSISTMPKNWKYVLSTLSVVIIAVGSIRPYQSYPDFWNTYVVQGIYLIWFFSLIAAGKLMYPILRNAFSGQVISPSEKWLSAIYLGNVIIAAAFFLAFFGSSWAYYITGPMVFSFFLYLLAYGYYNNRWFELTDKETPPPKYKKKIADHDAQELLQKLHHLMEDQKLYKKSSLKLREMAEHLNIPAHQLSQLLNDNLGKSYSNYLSEYRVEQACKIMHSDAPLSLEGIGYEVGFRSKSNFFTSFKRITGLTPSQFQQQKMQQNGSVL